MNYDIQLKSELFDLNKNIRLCQFRYTFESILNPLKVSTEAWEYNKHKNIFARIIDWFKRFITITIPTFFKKIINLKVSPMTTDKIRVIVASTESLFTNVQLTADKKNDTWAKIYEMKDNLESEFKKHEQDIVKELSSEKLSEKNFVKLSPEYEKKLKLTSEKAKNLLNRYKDDPNISKKFAEISNICTSQISQINKLMKIGSITEWEKHTRENTSSINVDDYIKSDGNVSRAKISMDIQFDKINLGDIKKIASDPRIQKQFIGTEYKDKKPKSDWNEKHLKSVSYASDTEVFNLDYMLYLYEVAQYVNKKKK